MIRRLIPTRRYPRALTVIGLAILAVASALLFNAHEFATFLMEKLK